MNRKVYITSPNLQEYTHGFFKKKGGVSSGIYESLNCGKGSNDKESNILNNRKIISDLLSFNYKGLLIANQHHSNKVEIIKKYQNNILCDGMITLSNQITLGVLTADCCPVLVGHKKKYIAAVIHLGWRGLFNGIIENFFHKLKLLNIQKDDLVFALGPCIGKNSYEVDLVFKNNFLKKDKTSKNYFRTANKSILFDLIGYAKNNIIKLGCNNIWCSEYDTFKQNNDFFSYRYSINNKLSDYGRMLSVIKI